MGLVGFNGLCMGFGNLEILENTGIMYGNHMELLRLYGIMYGIMYGYGMMKFPICVKIDFMFQTTNQYSYKL